MGKETFRTLDSIRREVGEVPTQTDVWVEVKTKTHLVLVHGLTVDYDQILAEPIVGSLCSYHATPSDYSMRWWNGGKRGIVKGVTIPLYCPDHYVFTDVGRLLQKRSGIGYGRPAELYALKDEATRQALRGIRIQEVVCLGRSDRELWQDPDGNRWAVILDLRPSCPIFSLSYPHLGLNVDHVLIGAPQA